MYTVNQVAKKLQVTPERVRNMIYDGVLPAEKFGRIWTISEEAVLQRLATKPGAGRPKSFDKTRETWVFGQTSLDAKKTRRLYNECKSMLSGCYDSEFLAQAESQEELAFYLTVADFFLQEKQKELIDQGVF